MSVTLEIRVPIEFANRDTHKHETLEPAELLSAAILGDRDACKHLVLRYTELVQRVIHHYRLTHSDSEDVCQTVWMRLWQHLDRIREPRALPGWIMTTARNEALKVAMSNRRMDLVDPLDTYRLDDRNEDAELVDELLRTERNRALRNGLAELEPKHRELLLLLHAEPQVPYREISRRLGIPTGSIGPTRARSIAKLRATSSVTTLIHTERGTDLPASA